MTLQENLRIALRALRVNKLRSALTLLGIVIGVAAVIVMLVAGAGARARIGQEIGALGSNLLLVQPGALSDGGASLGAGTRRNLTEEDAEAIGRDILSVDLAAPLVSDTARAVHGSRNWSTEILGVTPEYLLAREWSLRGGRMVTADDIKAAARIALLGATVAERLFGGEDPLGQTIRLGNVPFTVVGLLKRRGQGAGRGDEDDTVLVPLSTAKLRIRGGAQSVNPRAVDLILVKVREADGMAAAQRQIGELLRQRHGSQPGGPDDFAIRDLAALLLFEQEAFQALSLLLTAIASISLVVGGISIMNIMLVSVTERQREIGLRLAVGARRRDLRYQFLVEAVTLSLLGGVAGVVLGSVSAVVFAELAEWPVLIEPGSILLAVGFAAAVGIASGFYPAHKASRLDPIEALRFE